MDRYHEKNPDPTTIYPGGDDRDNEALLSVRLSVWHKGRALTDTGDFIVNTAKAEIFIFTDNPLKIGERILFSFHVPYTNAYLGEFEGEVTSYCVSRSNWPSGMHAVIINSSWKMMKRLKGFLELKGSKIDLVT